MKWLDRWSPWRLRKQIREQNSRIEGIEDTLSEVVFEHKQEKQAVDRLLKRAKDLEHEYIQLVIKYNDLKSNHPMLKHTQGELDETILGVFHVKRLLSILAKSLSGVDTRTSISENKEAD